MVLSTQSDNRIRNSRRLAARVVTAALIVVGAVVAPVPSRSSTSTIEATGTSTPDGADAKRGPTGVGARSDRLPLVLDLQQFAAARLSPPSPQSPESTTPTPNPGSPTTDVATASAVTSIAESTDPTTDPASETTTASTTTRRSTTTRQPTTTAVTPTAAPTTTRRSTTTRQPTTTRRSTTTRQPTTTAVTPTTASPSSTSASTTTTTTTARPTVVWEEHFNGLDTSRWATEHSTYGDGNNELQCYQPDNVTVSGGRLILTARSETVTCPRGRQRSVSSGMVRSRGLTFSPGQAIEFRVKLTPADPADQGGLWPAVWASSWAGSWPTGGELDWLEVMTAEDPRRAMFSMHYADRSGGHELQNKAVPTGDYFSDSWHTVRFDYGHGGRLRWYLDGRVVFSVDHAVTSQGYPAPFDRTIGEIKINLAIGGTPGPLAPGALGSSGATFEVDYIKVYDL